MQAGSPLVSHIRVGCLVLASGWCFLFTLNGSHPITRSFTPSLTDPDWKHFYSITVWRIVIKTHLGNVNHNPFTYSVGQNQLLRNGELRARLRQENVSPGFASSILLSPCPYCAAKVSSGWVLWSGTVTVSGYPTKRLPSGGSG